MTVKRDFIFAEDIGSRIEFVIKNRLYGTYDLATGKMYTLKELCDIIRDVTQSALNIVDNKKKDIECPPAIRIPCNIRHTELPCGLANTLLFFKSNNTLITRLIS
jgi:nucleoside-diphosphate-sugar epimerase